MPSTVIHSFDYDPGRRELRITFQSGRIYRYLDVPEEIPAAMRAERSKGSYFNRKIRGAFAFVVEHHGAADAMD
jgi:hypothetical protein